MCVCFATPNDFTVWCKMIEIQYKAEKTSSFMSVVHNSKYTHNYDIINVLCSFRRRKSARQSPREYLRAAASRLGPVHGATLRYIAWVMWRTTAVDRVVPRCETGPSSIVRLSATPPPPACCSLVALALPVYAAAVAASVNGPMSRGTRFRGGVDGGLDTPGSAAGAVFWTLQTPPSPVSPKPSKVVHTRANSYL